MSDDIRETRIQELERDNARLRRLLDDRGATSTLRHQTRNVLGLVRSILRRSAETTTSVEDYAAHLEGRLDALLRVQSMLIAGSDEGLDLHMLIADELTTNIIHEGERVVLDGPQVRLPPKTAEVLGLAIHELATNAIKYGAMTVPAGRLSITWSISGPTSPTLDLVWAETGLSGLAPSPAFRGFGIETLEKMLDYQLQAENRLEFLPDGLRWIVRLPLPAAGSTETRASA